MCTKSIWSFYDAWCNFSVNVIMHATFPLLSLSPTPDLHLSTSGQKTVPQLVSLPLPFTHYAMKIYLFSCSRT